MKLINEIWTNLKNSIKFEDLSDEIKEKIANDYTLTLWKCDSCNNIFEEDEADSKKVNMEVYYGVASLFPDSHYSDIAVCPRCGSEDIEEVGIFNKEDFEEELKESEWKRIGGPRRRFMDEGYSNLIEKKLIPMLNAYKSDLSVNTYPSSKKPGVYMYRGTYGEKPFKLYFYNANTDSEGVEEGNFSMLVKLLTDDNFIDVGVVDLTNQDGLEDAFSLITRSLDDTGITKDKESTKEEPEEDDEDVKTLLAFREENKDKE